MRVRTRKVASAQFGVLHQSKLDETSAKFAGKARRPPAAAACGKGQGTELLGEIGQSEITLANDSGDRWGQRHCPGVSLRTPQISGRLWPQRAGIEWDDWGGFSGHLRSMT